MPVVLIGVVLFVVFVLYLSVIILQEYERAVVFRLGRFSGVKGPGVAFLIPFVDRPIRVSLREVVMDVPSQDVITRDNVSVKVNAVIYFRVVHPEHSVIRVENFLYATSQLSQTTLRSVCGEQELDGLLTQRENLNRDLQSRLDEATERWGIKVRAVEIKHIDLPADMQRAMAKQAEAERERRAKIIHAEGEHEASERLRAASDVMAQSPFTLQLRYLQTLADIATEKNSTIIFPLPLDLIAPLLQTARLTAPPATLPPRTSNSGS